MKIINQTRITLSGLDRLRAFFGKSINLTTEIEVSVDVDVLSTVQTINIEKVFPKPEASFAMAGLPEAYDELAETARLATESVKPRIDKRA